MQFDPIKIIKVRISMILYDAFEQKSSIVKRIAHPLKEQP